MEELSKRIDDVHRRLDDLRADMNNRFAEVNQRFGEVNQRFGELREDMNQRFDELRPIYKEAYRKNVVGEAGVPVAQYLEFARDKSRRKFEWITQRVPTGAGRRVLEVGCATGQLLRYFKDTGWEAVGVEPTRAFAEYGSRTHGLRILPVLFEEATLEPGFDLVILSQVLEHVAAPAAVLARAAALLRPGGRLYVGVPYYPTLLPIRPARELFISTHLYAFSPVSLTNLAGQCGLVVEAEGTMSRYLCAILRSDGAAKRAIVREDPTAVRSSVRGLALRYFLLHDSRFLLAEWAKRQLRGLLGDGAGERAIGTLRRWKHRVVRRRPLPAVPHS